MTRHHTYDLHNPTRGARVIYDGITNASPIRVGPGETMKGVVLADHVVETLRRDAACGTDVDLDVTEAEEPAADSAAASPTYPTGQYAAPRPPEDSGQNPEAARKALRATTEDLAKKNAPAVNVGAARGKSKIKKGR